MHLTEGDRRSFNGTCGLRRYFRRTGRTPRGHLIWSQDELDLLGDLWPDMASLSKALPRRTQCAMSNKARRLGLTTPRQLWQSDEKGRMVPPYKAGEPITVVVEKVQTRTKRQIYSKASHLKVRRPRRPPKPTGMRIVDLIRERAFAKGYTMLELDEWVRRKCYFRSPRDYDWRAIAAALRILGGSIAATWSKAESVDDCRN